MIRVLSRQGQLNGDLNLVQNHVLQWLMGKELRDQAERDRQQLEMAALAANQNTNPALLEHLQKERGAAEQEEIPDSQVDWLTPQSQEDVDAMLEDLGAVL